MKMGPGIFWGVILIVLGISILFKVLFGISMFRVIIAVLFILVGVRMLIGRPAWTKKGAQIDDNTIMFGERVVQVDNLENTEYNTIFGKSVYDLRNLQDFNNLPEKVEFNAIFGQSEIYLPKNLYVKIKADAVFASVVMPNGNTAAFSTSNFESKPDSVLNNEPLQLEAHAVFGNITIKQ